MFVNELTTQANARKRRRQSTQMESYTKDEDKLICEGLKKTGEDPKTDAEQK